MTAMTAQTAHATPKRALSRRPSLPERTKMTMTDLPPADAQKPDSLAVDDVFDQLKATGSLEAAARRLAEIAMREETLPKVVQRRQAWEDDPEEAEWQQQQAEEAQGGAARRGEEEEEIEHLQQVCDGLWVGDLVAAMDGEGLRERGIVSTESSVGVPDASIFGPSRQPAGCRAVQVAKLGAALGAVLGA